MDFSESEEITMYRESVRRFLDKECPVEKILEWEKADELPRSLMYKMRDLGILGLTVPEEYGGMGRQVVAMTAVMDEMAARWGTITGYYNMSVAYGSLNIAYKGSEKQKKEYLPRTLTGDALFAYGLSEPDTGADLADVKTRAERRDGKVIVNGGKRWTSGANMADYILTLVRSGPVEERRRNLSFIIMPVNAPGVTIVKTDCMGCQGIPTHDVTFDNVVLDEEDMILGGVDGWNKGWQMLAGPALEIEKLTPTVIALGIARGALREAWDYAQQRVQGGKRICAHQAVRHVLSDCQTKLKACELMTYNAAWKVENELPSAVDTSMAKLFVSETAKEIVLACQQYVMGAYGYAKGFQMERFVRDILSVPIVGGSSAIQRNNIANLMKLPKE
jgi:alkylation response protein AidB-like acyl-CoA dehydrogenase